MGGPGLKSSHVRSALSLCPTAFCTIHTETSEKTSELYKKLYVRSSSDTTKQIICVSSGLRMLDLLHLCWSQSSSVEHSGVGWHLCVHLFLMFCMFLCSYDLQAHKIEIVYIVINCFRVNNTAQIRKIHKIVGILIRRQFRHKKNRSRLGKPKSFSRLVAVSWNEMRSSPTQHLSLLNVVCLAPGLAIIVPTRQNILDVVVTRNEFLVFALPHQSCKLLHVRSVCLKTTLLRLNSNKKIRTCTNKLMRHTQCF